MSLTKQFTYFGVPAVVGVGVAWLGFALLRNEKKLEQRRMELEIELNAKCINRKRTLLNESSTKPLTI